MPQVVNKDSQIYIKAYEHTPFISNKTPLKPHAWKKEPLKVFIIKAGADNGYSFKHFWSNCYHLLGEYGKLDGIQQLCHNYYCKNGDVYAEETVLRIKKLLKL